MQAEALRRTPAGVAVLSFRLAHQSVATEGGVQRRVELEMPCLALGQVALEASALPQGSRVGLRGFLAARSHRGGGAVLHVTGLQACAPGVSGQI